MSEPNLLTDKSNAWEMELFWEKHKRRILISAIVLGIAVLGAAVYLIRDYYIRTASRALFARAFTGEELQTVISRYPSSEAAASALLLLAAEQRRNGKPEEADATYQKFLKQFPKHSLASGVALGIAENALVAGRPDEGISQFQVLAVKYPTSYAAPFALYTGADLLAFQPGQAAEAKKQLKNLSQQFPDSISAQYAANLLSLLGGRQGGDEEKISSTPTQQPVK